jgi:DnaJ-class molecular chaperone
MSKDFYKILGVERNASSDEIKKAFRKLAHEHHPDKKTGNAERFKEANEAYSVLSDAQKRQQYDTFGSAGPQMGGSGFGGFNAQDFGGFDFSQFSGGFGQGGVQFDLNDILGSMFGGGRARQRRGRNILVDVELSFKESIFGAERELNVRKGLKVRIPAGIEDGETVRLPGAGEAVEDGVPGDLHVRVHVRNDTIWRKERYNLVTELPVKLSDALLGAEYSLMTLDGEIKLKIPEGITHGEVLRVKGRGVPADKHHRGDALVVVRIVMPKKLSRDMKKKIEELKKEGL